jgi:hypothetical protein
VGTYALRRQRQFLTEKKTFKKDTFFCICKIFPEKTCALFSLGATAATAHYYGVWVEANFIDRSRADTSLIHKNGSRSIYLGMGQSCFRQTV